MVLFSTCNPSSSMLHWHSMLSNFRFCAFLVTKLCLHYLCAVKYPFHFLFFSSSFSMMPSFIYVYPVISWQNQPWLLYYFLNIFQCKDCHTRFTDMYYNALDISRRAIESPTRDPKERPGAMEYKAASYKHPSLVPWYHCIDEAVLPEFCTQQICHELRSSTAGSASA